MIFSLGAVLLLIAAAFGLPWLSSRKASGSDRRGPSYGSDAEFLDNFSLSAYQPMLRLASHGDRNYLVSAHGAPLATCYRKIQRRLLREYLTNLSTDFNRLYSIATERAVHAVSDTENLSLALLEQQMSFIFQVWMIEARLLVDRAIPYTPDLKPLVGYVEALAAQTRELATPRLSYHVV